MRITIVVTLDASKDAFWAARCALVEQTMKIARGNITYAAKLLGVHRQSLQRTLTKMGYRDLHVTPVQ